MALFAQDCKPLDTRLGRGARAPARRRPALRTLAAGWLAVENARNPRAGPEPTRSRAELGQSWARVVPELGQSWARTGRNAAERRPGTDPAPRPRTAPGPPQDHPDPTDDRPRANTTPQTRGKAVRAPKPSVCGGAQGERSATRPWTCRISLRVPPATSGRCRRRRSRRGSAPPRRPTPGPTPCRRRTARCRGCAPD
jgi:hypothetical protein